MVDDRQVRLNRADLGFECLMDHRLHHPQRKVFGWRNWWMTRTYEALWPLANAWSATCTLASLPDHGGVRDVLTLLLDGLPAFHRDGPAVLTGQGPVGFESAVVPPLGSGGDAYYDDNAWLGLALVRHHELCRDDVSLPLAQRIFEFVVSGWSTEGDWATPGGIRWKEDPANRSRHTCTNGPAAELGARLHRLTGDPAQLEWAGRIYDWTRAALGRADSLYADRIDPDGSVVEDRWTYNQGAMVGAGVLLAAATGDPDYLTQARATAAAALDRFDLDQLDRNGPAFNAVFFRNLFQLPSVPDGPAVPAVPDGPPGPAVPDGPAAPAVPAASNGPGLAGGPPGWALAAAYDDLLWEERDRRTGLFPGDGSPLNKMGPMVQIDALLAGALPHP